MKPIGEKVSLRGKTYEISGYHKRSYLLKDENGKVYKCGPDKLDRMENNLSPKRQARVAFEMTCNLSEPQIIDRLRSIECELSPENLSCDGELAPSLVRRRYSKLMSEKTALEKKLGRALSDKELYE